MSFNMDTTREYDLPTGGIRSSNPRNYFFPDEKREESLISLIRNDLRSAITSGFGLPSDDSYVYHAIASVTLAQVEDAVKASTSNGLCDWYQDVEGHQVCLFYQIWEFLILK